jgi:hypothetical protein
MLLRRALVLGDGPLASAMAEDLASTRDLSVTSAAALARQADGGLADQFSDCDVVLSALPPESAAGALPPLLQARCLVADANARLDDARALHALALEKKLAACVGCGEGLALLLAGPAVAADVRVAALLTTALARRLLTGDFRDHWGIWTPERLVARVGMAHGLRQDLRERGIELRSG